MRGSSRSTGSELRRCRVGPRARSRSRPRTPLARRPTRIGRPPTRTVPLVHVRSPVIASASSRWPLPATPAIAAISPARTVNETPRTAGAPRSPSAQSSSSSSTGSVSGRTFASRRTACTSRPTISVASECGVASAVWTVASAFPARSTVTRSETAFTSLSLCEMKMTVRPSAAISRSVTNSASASCGVSTAVGSSRISTRAC